MYKLTIMDRQTWNERQVGPPTPKHDQWMFYERGGPWRTIIDRPERTDQVPKEGDKVKFPVIKSTTFILDAAPYKNPNDMYFESDILIMDRLRDVYLFFASEHREGLFHIELAGLQTRAAFDAINTIARSDKGKRTFLITLESQ